MSYGKGTICGQVIGDVLGPGTEGMTEKEISQKYPNGITHYSDIFQDRHRKWTIELSVLFGVMILVKTFLY